MKECELYQELISRLVDGELNKKEYAAVEAHMADCAECSAMYAVFASLSDIIGSEDEPLPEALHENIMAGVRRQAMINHNRRRLSKPMRNTLAAAACAALVLFAAKGLAPEKAADTVLTAQQAAVMEAEIQPVEKENTVSESLVEAAPAAPAAPATALPTASVNPVPTPVPSKDVYLGSFEDKSTAGSGSNNSSNNNNNYVVVTAEPKEVVVSTPAPTPVPTVAATLAPAPVATPAPTVAASPAATPAVMPTESSAPAVYAAAKAVSPEPEEAAPEMDAAPAPAAEVTEGIAATEEPAETETPSLSKRFIAFFMPKPVAEPEESPEEEAPAQTEAPAETAVPSPVAAEEVNPPRKVRIVLETLEKLNSLEDMLDGEEAKLPKDAALESYVFTLKEPEEQLADYSLEVYVYADCIRYVQVLGDEESIECLSPCKIEDFEKFMETLSEEERAPLMVSPEPSEAEASETPGPETSASPVPGETPAAETEKPNTKA